MDTRAGNGLETPMPTAASSVLWFETYKVLMIVILTLKPPRGNMANACDVNQVKFLCECLNEMKSLPEYKGTSRNCRQIATTLELISLTLNDKSSQTSVIWFAAEITAMLKSVLEKLIDKRPSESTVASITTRRMRMWKAYHKATSCAEYKQKWITLLNSLALDDVSKMPISIII